MNWILLNSDEVIDGCARLTDGRAKHICKVLRAEPGKELRIGLVDGPFGIGTVVEASPEQVVLSCEFEAAPPPRPKIDLLLAMPRPKVLKRLWTQFAALGVGRIFITNAEKVERYYFDSHILSPEFYRPRLIEGLQQAGDTLVPDVETVWNLGRFLDETRNELEPVVKILADPSGTKDLCHVLEGTLAAADQNVLLAIGPEGGWTMAELELLKSHRFELFSLGARVLRTDTACIALLGLISTIRCCSEGQDFT